ncbi:hypothetical protein [Nocardioides taihuensis]|uniref:Lipoprotein n=1 Tax=Nocardioides taihuensis TaxID=1835606 RepID=A0ABW0BQV7_9ACTN
MTISTSSRSFAAAAATAAIAIAFGTAACGTDTGRDTAAAPAAIGQAPFHTSADAIDRDEKRNTQFHGSPAQIEHQQATGGQQGRPFTPPDSRIPD